MTEADRTELMESQRAHRVNPANSTSSTRLPLKGSRDHRTAIGLTQEKKKKIILIRVTPVYPTAVNPNLSVFYFKILNIFKNIYVFKICVFLISLIF